MYIWESILPVPGIKLYEEEETLVLYSEKRLFTLNSSVYGGGFRHPYFILNHQVKAGYDGHDPEEDLVQSALTLGLLPEDGTGMMTAALVRHASIFSEVSGDLSVTAIVTAGTRNAMAAGGTPPPFEYTGVGTINIILLIDGNLTEGGMVNAVITATEGKTMALQDRDIKDAYSGEAASGTSTDAVVVAVTGRGVPLPYAGTATRLGAMTGRTVRRATQEAIDRYLAYKAAEAWQISQGFQV